MQEKYNFGEKQQEYSATDKKMVDVVVSPKYVETKKRVIEMLESGIYKGLNESYFWILMNRTKQGKMMYSGLIISHDGMKVINDNLPENNQVDPMCFTKPLKAEFGDGLYMVYQDESTFEVGEISIKNCTNAYPYAMLLKRTFDRVVKDKAKLYGVYSEEEADEFKNKQNEVPEAPEIKEEVEKINEYQWTLIKQLYSDQDILKMMRMFSVTKPSEITSQQAQMMINDRRVENENN